MSRPSAKNQNTLRAGRYYFSLRDIRGERERESGARKSGITVFGPKTMTTSSSTRRANTVDEMFYEFHKESLVGGSGKRLRDPRHVIKNTGKFMER